MARAPTARMPMSATRAHQVSMRHRAPTCAKVASAENTKAKEGKPRVTSARQGMRALCSTQPVALRVPLDGTTLGMWKFGNCWCKNVRAPESLFVHDQAGCMNAHRVFCSRFSSLILLFVLVFDFLRLKNWCLTPNSGAQVRFRLRLKHSVQILRNWIVSSLPRAGRVHPLRERERIKPRSRTLQAVQR